MTREPWEDFYAMEIEDIKRQAVKRVLSAVIGRLNVRMRDFAHSASGTAYDDGYLVGLIATRRILREEREARGQ